MKGWRQEGTWGVDGPGRCGTAGEGGRLQELTRSTAGSINEKWLQCVAFGQKEAVRVEGMKGLLTGTDRSPEIACQAAVRGQLMLKTTRVWDDFPLHSARLLL